MPCPPRITTILCITITVALTAPAAARQVIQNVGVLKAQQFDQIGGEQVQQAPADQLPFRMSIAVGGTDLEDLAPAPAVSGPITYPEPGHNGGVLGFNAGESAWLYGAPDFDDVRFETLAELDSFFGEGTYTLTADGLAIPVDLTGRAFPATPPAMTPAGGTWIDGGYQATPDSELTVTTSVFAEYGTNAQNVIALGIFGEDYEQEIFAFATEEPGADSLSLVVPAGSLSVGTYELECVFISATDFSLGLPGSPEALVFAAYESATTLVLEVVAPRPSCPADLDADEVVGFSDLLQVASNWGGTGAADLDGDGTVGFGDLLLVLGAWGPC